MKHEPISNYGSLINTYNYAALIKNYANMINQEFKVTKSRPSKCESKKYKVDTKPKSRVLRKNNA